MPVELKTLPMRKRDVILQRVLRDRISEWNGQIENMSPEQDVVFTGQGCQVVDGRQTEFYHI